MKTEKKLKIIWLFQNIALYLQMKRKTKVYEA